MLPFKIKCLFTKRSKFKAELAIPSDSSFLLFGTFGFIYLVMGYLIRLQLRLYGIKQLISWPRYES
jgi:hypothetical protein